LDTPNNKNMHGWTHHKFHHFLIFQALRATKSQDKATGGAKGSDAKSSGGKAAGNKAQSGACSIQ